MESSQLTADAEEYCSSSESGWTMYLSSPIRDGGGGGGGEVGDEVGHDDDRDDDTESSGGTDGGDEEDEDEGDSMASDASTGPARYGRSCENCHLTNVMGHSLHHADDEDELEDDCSHEYSAADSYKEHYKKLDDKRDEKKAAAGFSHTKAAGGSHSSSKQVRKTRLAADI